MPDRSFNLPEILFVWQMVGAFVVIQEEDHDHPERVPPRASFRVTLG